MYKRIKEFLAASSLLCTSIRQSALAFSSVSATTTGLHSSTRATIRLLSASPDLEDFISENDAPALNQSPGTELWLDLRSTVIHPKAAMDYLESQLMSSTHFVDRILLSEHVFQNLVDSSDLYLSASRILYQTSEKDAILASTSDGLSVPFGSVLPVPSDTDVMVEDPIQAIQIISGGKWLVLGNEGENVDHDRESLRLDGVGNFLEIACTASGSGAWGASAETNGLLLPSSPTQTEGESKSHGVGGVALKCYSTSALMKLASALRLIKPGFITSITNSGIILQSTDDGPASIPTAIILPFDVELWEVAILLFGKEDILNFAEYE